MFLDFLLALLYQAGREIILDVRFELEFYHLRFVRTS